MVESWDDRLLAGCQTLSKQEESRVEEEQEEEQSLRSQGQGWGDKVDKDRKQGGGKAYEDPNEKEGFRSYMN